MDSLGYNPAGLIGFREPFLETTYSNGLSNDAFGFAGYAHPLPFGTIAVGVEYYNAGQVALNFSNGASQTVNAEQDVVGLVSLAVPLGAGLSIGATAKEFKLDLAEQALASSYAGDFGILWRTPLQGLNFGTSIQNAGPSVKFEQQGDPLPTTSRAGVSYLLNTDPLGWKRIVPYDITHFLFTAEAVRVRSEAAAARAGFEMKMPTGPQSYAALRFGYVVNHPPESFTGGVGIRERRFVLDYAYQIQSSVGSTNNLSLGIAF